MNLVFAVVTIGDKCRQEYKSLFFGSHQRYCSKHGYRLHIVEGFIDNFEADISLASLQKILIPSIESIQSADLLVIVDYDILINVETTPPLETLLKESCLVGVVDEASQPTYEKRLELNLRNGWNRDASAYYKSCGFDLKTDLMFNTGFILVNPVLYRDFFLEIYKFGKANARNHPYGFLYEQALVGFCLQSNNLYEVVDSKWNAIFNLGLLDRQISDSDLTRVFFVDFYRNNYFIHFAGRSHTFLKPLIGALSDGGVVLK
jgi:lipopolysaccharide biosynthesis glycosyltransferase